MAKKLDYIIVVDIEATCWENDVDKGDQEQEIIEIGICKLDVETGERVSKESILVKPERSTVSEFCTKLTTLTQKQVDTGLTFKEACRYIAATYGRNRIWASYGDYDRRQFERECRSKFVSIPFGPSHINVKSLFSLKHKLSREVGMAGAMSILGQEIVGTHHRGVDDAFNIALILSKTLEF